MKTQLLVCVLVATCVLVAAELPKMMPVSETSEFDHEPEYYESEDAAEEPSFAEVEQVVGSPGYTLKPGASFQPGWYWPPTVPYRMPSFPFDNPTFTAQPSMYNVPLPPPWRSDPFGINSDGARYMENMQKYDFYPNIPYAPGTYDPSGQPSQFGAMGVGVAGVAVGAPAAPAAAPAA